MKKQFVLLAITLLLCLQGCAVFYIPPFGGKIEKQGDSTSRYEIDNFLEIGKTSMEEIQSTWGYPYQIQDSRNIWVYIGLRTDYAGFIQLVYPGLTPVYIDSMKKPILLFIKFDKNDCLKRYELKKPVKNFVIGGDVRQQALEWDNSFEVQSKER